MGLGIVLFLVTLFVIVYQVLHKENLGVSLPAFLVIALVMVGYPSIKSFQYKDGVFDLEKQTREVQADPQDKAARASLNAVVAQMAPRVQTGTAQEITKLAAAQYALGKESAAKAALDKALSRDPQAEPALALKNRIESIDQIRKLNTLAQSQPQNDAIKRQLAQTVSIVSSQFKLANPNAILDVARAQITLGEHKAALDNLNKVISIQPSVQATRLKEELNKK